MGLVGQFLVLVVVPFFLLLNWADCLSSSVDTDTFFYKLSSLSILIAIVGGYLADLSGLRARNVTVSDAGHYFAGLMLALGLFQGIIWWMPGPPGILGRHNVLGFVRPREALIISVLIAAALIRGGGQRPLKAIITVSMLVIAVILGGANRFATLEENSPGSFSNVAPDDVRGSLLYFSVVTFATVGYGDIDPVSKEARFAVATQIMTNVVISTVLVALLVVALVPTRGREESSSFSALLPEWMLVVCRPLAAFLLIVGVIGAMPAFLLLGS